MLNYGCLQFALPNILLHETSFLLSDPQAYNQQVELFEFELLSIINKAMCEKKREIKDVNNKTRC